MKPKYEKPTMRSMGLPKAWGQQEPEGICSVGLAPGVPGGTCSAGTSPESPGLCYTGISDTGGNLCFQGINHEPTGCVAGNFHVG